MKWFTLTAALMVCCAGTSSADAGLLDLFDGMNILDSHGSCGGCCAPAPKCCAPKPVCCKPAPKCCAPKPVCCAPKPVCCAPKPVCCAPKPVCCKPAPKCCAPKPTCCAPKPPSCCDDDGDLLGDLFSPVSDLCDAIFGGHDDCGCGGGCNSCGH